MLDDMSCSFLSVSYINPIAEGVEIWCACFSMQHDTAYLDMGMLIRDSQFADLYFALTPIASAMTNVSKSHVIVVFDVMDC